MKGKMYMVYEDGEACEHLMVSFADTDDERLILMAGLAPALFRIGGEIVDDNKMSGVLNVSGTIGRSGRFGLAFDGQPHLCFMADDKPDRVWLLEQIMDGKWHACDHAIRSDGEMKA